MDLSALLKYASIDQARYINAVIAHEGNVTAAAASLGVSRSTVRSALSRAAKKGEAATVDDLIPFAQRLKGKSTLAHDPATKGLAWTKTERDTLDPELDASQYEGPDFALEKVSVLDDGQGRPRARWRSFNKQKQAQHEAFRAAVVDVAEKYAGFAVPVPPPTLPFDAAQWLNVIPLGDPHIGMLAHASETGDHHDLKIAVKDLEFAFDLAVAQAPPADTAYILNLGDYFHAQDQTNATPGHGNRLDVDGRWPKVVRAGLGVLVYGINRALQHYKRVIVGNVRGNHDPDASCFLPIYLEAFFRNDPRVEVLDNFNPYHALRFGQNMIATCHGDGAKRDKIPGLFSTRMASIWGATTKRVCYAGHIHHEVRWEGDGMTVENFQTLAGKDAWHGWKGYNADRSISVISHHEVYGATKRLRIPIDEIRDAQRAAV